MRCPICKGSGDIEEPSGRMDEAKARRVMAKALRAEGYTIRQIMRLIGWKSPRSVMVALEAED